MKVIQNDTPNYIIRKSVESPNNKTYKTSK